MIDRGRFPTVGRVTSCALSAQLTRMRIIISMAGCAVLRRALELPVDMAVLAGNSIMLAIQLEGKLGVIDRGGLPALRRVTGLALIAERACMRIIIRVAGCTVHGRAFINPIDVTALTGDRRMLTIQCERKLGVVNARGLPGIGSMARRTVRSELTVMEVVLLVAGVTFLRSGAQVGEAAVIDMAGRTLCLSMLADQVERNFIMIKSRAV